MLTYKMGNLKLLEPVVLIENNEIIVKLYKSPFREFQLIQIEIISKKEGSKMLFEFPHIGLVMSGEGEIVFNENAKERNEKIQTHESFYILPNTEFKFRTQNKIKIVLCGSH